MRELSPESSNRRELGKWGGAIGRAMLEPGGSIAENIDIPVGRRGLIHLLLGRLARLL